MGLDWNEFDTFYFFFSDVIITGVNFVNKAWLTLAFLLKKNEDMGLYWNDFDTFQFL